MALLIPTNVEVKIYRTAAPATPYVLGALSATVKGVLTPAAHAGRFGAALYLKWTHKLLLPPGVDIRDAYNSQLDPARDNTKGDTITLGTAATDRVAYYCVFVEHVGRGLRNHHIRAFLDRFYPETFPTLNL